MIKKANVRQVAFGNFFNKELKILKIQFNVLPIKPYTAISTNVVGSKLQAYATIPNGSVGRSRGLLRVPNTNEI